MPRTYLLSPARLDGQRAQLVFRAGAMFPLAQALRSDEGAELGAVFSFLSGLYFRGKLTYAQRFAASAAQVKIITTNRGLLPAATRVTLDDLAAFAKTDIDRAEPAFVKPLLRDARRLARSGERGLVAAEQDGPVGREPGSKNGEEVVLLGSIASTKYVETLVGLFGERLVFPLDFVGRGDMSRGGLLLRAADAGEELRYGPVANAKRRGVRPPKLAPRVRA